MFMVLFSFALVSPPAYSDMLTYRPGPEDGIDMWYSSYYDYGSNHFVNDHTLRVGGWGDWYDSLLKFNLGCLPKQANQVTLALMPYSSGSGSPVSVNLYRVLGSWNEVTGWSGALQVSYIRTKSAPTPGTWWDIDITDLYNKWQSQDYANYGILLESVSNNNQFNFFRSSDYAANESERPKLIINYTPNPGEPFGLCFPLKRPGDGPWTTKTSAVMDHNSNTGYVKAYNGEEGSVSPYVYSAEVVGYKKPSSMGLFTLPLLNYDDGVSQSRKEWLFYDGHTGYDYPADLGVQVYADANGTADILYDKYNTLVINHGNGYSSFYLHMSAIFVWDGEPVKKGQLVGKVGHEGAGADHLHFTLKNGVQRIDPYGNGMSGNFWQP